MTALTIIKCQYANGNEIFHRRLDYENAESIFDAPYKNNLTLLSQEHEQPDLKCAITMITRSI